MSLQTPLSRVRGLGSAKDGVAHWWAQRVTAVALLPLCVWLAAALATSAGMDYAAATEWLSNPLTAILMILLIGAGFHHVQLGLQVASIMTVKLAAVALAVAGVFSVLKIAFGG